MHIQTPSTWGQRIATLALVSTLSVAATIAVMPLKPVAAQSAGAAPLVRGLPDFTELVDVVGPSVVNIRTVEKVRQGARSGGQEEQMLEFFRRFGIPIPPGATPRGPRAERDGDEADRPRGVGSGFALTADGFIMTNAHVVDGADEVIVTLPDKREFKARIVGADKRTDVAVVKIEATGLNAVKIGDVNRLRVGEWVMAIGSPFGLENTVTAGIVSAKQRDTGDYLPFIQTDVAINPGNSGGPLINMRGEVVGINSQIYSRSGGFQGISFAIPIDEAVRVSDQLRSSGRVTRGRIGVGIDQVSKEVAESIGLGKPEGALVRSVEPDSPAAKAGIEPGDIIVRFDGKTIEKSVDLPRLVGNTKPGARSTVTVFRRGSTKDLTITVGEVEPERVAQRPEPKDTKPPVTSLVKSLGLSLSELTDETKAELKLGGGVRIDGAEGAAARAGLREGDVILAVANTEVKDLKAFEAVVAKADKARPINVLFRRGEWAQYAVIRPSATR
ncbi:MAG: Do family serine endopeptidase [Hydrogenophaga sp.]|nr:Do family serine endopeptidase [Hydrogenophaga sp.]